MGLTTRWRCLRRALGVYRTGPLLPCASAPARSQAWGVGRASHMTRWASWLRPSQPPACVCPSRARGPPKSRWRVRGRYPLVGGSVRRRPRSFTLAAGRRHAGAHLPPAGLVPLALLEGRDGTDARGAAVLRKDHLRQCHRGEQPSACGLAGVPRLSPPRGPARAILRVWASEVVAGWSAAEGAIPRCVLVGAVPLTRPGKG